MVAGRFRRRSDALPEVFQLVEHFLAEAGVSEAHRFFLDFALEELFTNAVKYNAHGEGEIGIQLRLLDGELQLTLSDQQATPFDPTAEAPSVDTGLPLGARTPGGLGIHLLKQLADRFEYAYADPVSTINLYKKLE